MTHVAHNVCALDVPYCVGIPSITCQRNILSNSKQSPFEAFDRADTRDKPRDIASRHVFSGIFYDSHCSTGKFASSLFLPLPSRPGKTVSAQKIIVDDGVFDADEDSIIVLQSTRQEIRLRNKSLVNTAITRGRHALYGSVCHVARTPIPNDTRLAQTSCSD